MVTIPETIFDEMVSHALREAPLECCGILAGKPRTVTRIYRMKNAAGSRTSYSLIPEDQLKVFQEIEKAHLNMVAIYHSHPHTIAFPSENDVKLAFYPGVAHIIISLKDGETTVKAFRITEEAIYLEPIRVAKGPEMPVRAFGSQLKDISLKRSARSVLECIGNTPLVRINRIGLNSGEVEIYAKMEGFNPGGSVKDRPALKIIEDAEKSGLLTQDKILLDSTSGNMGTAYAMIAAAKGYRLEVVMPANASEERKGVIQAFCGPCVRLTDPLEGSDGALREAHRLYEEDPEKYFLLDQYNNPSNPQAHYESTGMEIYHQTEGRITHFVCSVGTGGTVMGAGRRLKELNGSLEIIGVEPLEPLHGIEGLKHRESSIVPGIYDEQLLDGKIMVRTEQAYQMTEAIALKEGLFVGHSSGAAMVAALEVAQKIKQGVIVALFPDRGDRYVSLELWGSNQPIQGRIKE